MERNCVSIHDPDDFAETEEKDCHEVNAPLSAAEPAILHRAVIPTPKDVCKTVTLIDPVAARFPTNIELTEVSPNVSPNPDVPNNATVTATLADNAAPDAAILH